MAIFGIKYKEIKSAINEGNYSSKGKGLCCIGWEQLSSKWIIYTTTDGAPEGVRSEFLCIGSGFLPLPISEEGKKIFEEIFPI